jgi:uncharacterized iron-regulated membrane protein
MRKFFLVTHRWLGIGAAIVLIVVGISGAVLVYVKNPTLANFHTHLGIGEPGEWLVNTATVIASLLVIGGLVLWWRRKILSIDRSKGTWRFLFDLHHSLGIIGATLMLVIALSGTGLMLTEEIAGRLGLPKDDPNYPTRNEALTRKLIHAAHTGGPLNLPLKVLWLLGSVSFAVQAVSGFWVWWKPGRATAGVD